MELQQVLNTLASDIFRKQADYDYISARIDYRMEFRQQFLWMAQQAIEKYLKAILLFNGKSARYINTDIRKGKNIEFRHDLVKLHSEICKIEYLQFNLKDDVIKFLKYLVDFGATNRYMSHFSYVEPRSIQILDKSVWYIRKYCRYFPENIISNGQTFSIRDRMIADINNINFIDHSSKYLITGGELEKILSKPKNNISRKSLIWANLFYSERRRNQVEYQPYSSSEIPPQNRDWFKKEVDRIEIEKFIKF